MRHIFSIFLVLTTVSVTLFTHKAFAESSHVLPYPSFMPGSVFYKLNLIKEEFLKYWYFGDFGRFKYNLKRADKYLVETKTLFEYKQYLLGYKALKKSDLYFDKTLPYLFKAEKEGKNINKNKSWLKEAAIKHIEILARLKSEVPETFVWQPEKASSTTLHLKKLIEESISFRKKYL